MEPSVRIAELEHDIQALKDRLNSTSDQKDKLELEVTSLRCIVSDLQRQNDRFLSIIENLSKQNCK